MNNDFKTGIDLLKLGKAPGNSEVLERITVGTDSLTDFLKEKYFTEYISQGGSKIKFVTGKTGSGKTHFLQVVSLSAKEQGFLTVNFSARNTWLHDFKEMYAEIFKGADLLYCLKKCAAKIAKELGHDYTSIPPDMTFVDYLSSIGELDALIKKEIRNQLHAMFLKDPLIDNNFAIACSLLTGGILGHPVLESSNKALLLSWLSGNKDMKLAALRNLGLSPTKITKYNARHMLRSLSRVCSLASIPGILVTIDDADILVNSKSLDTIRYTKLKREDAYESIRELIDEIDTLRNVMFFYAFDRELIDNELSGIKSYHALWMRVQNEIVSHRFNKFTDIIDLDRFAVEYYGKDTLIEMSKRIVDIVNTHGLEMNPINDEMAEEFLARTQFSKMSLPRQVVLATINSSFITEENL